MQQVRYLFLLENAWMQHFNTICTRTGESLYWSQGALLLLHACNRSTGITYFNMHVVSCSSSECTHNCALMRIYSLFHTYTVSLNISWSFMGELYVWTQAMQFFSTPTLTCQPPSIMCGEAEWQREGHTEMALKMGCIVVLQNACRKSSCSVSPTFIRVILTQLHTSKVPVECTEIYWKDIFGVFKV